MFLNMRVLNLSFYLNLSVNLYIVNNIYLLYIVPKQLLAFNLAVQQKI